MQLFLRRRRAGLLLKRTRDIWPVNEKAQEKPAGWEGWPEGRRFALVLTHDVETVVGRRKCRKLMRLEESYGLTSSFFFVPERYKQDKALFATLKENGFEVGVHGLNHDGRLFFSKRQFLERAAKINRYIREWDAVGFRAPSMHHELRWLHHLDIAYDSSTYDTDPFEPMQGGVGTIFPFEVNKKNRKRTFLEMPYTLPQDHFLFIIKQEKTIDIWKEKLDWVAQHGGMVLLITHPDYMEFNRCRKDTCRYPAGYYRELLEYIATRYQGQYWNALPKELARFYTARQREPVCSVV